ncbi:MAG: aspartate/glutamate racemase family protein [Chitinophagales bacterium]
MSKKIIGIIGGMGPFAGVDVHKKIYQNTLATSDKEHLDIVHLAFSQDIPDRTAYLLGKISTNPATILAEKIKHYPLDVIGVACNTFHSPAIFKEFQAKLQNAEMQILHLPNEVKKAIERDFPKATIGVLCTLGTYKTQIYQNIFKNTAIKLNFLNAKGCEAIHESICNNSWGIKKTGYLSEKAKSTIENEIVKLLDCDAILLACTELPLIVKELSCSIPLIDCNEILARAFINAVSPDKLTNK